MDNINFVDDLPSMKLKANINNTVQLKTWANLVITNQFIKQHLPTFALP